MVDSPKYYPYLRGRKYELAVVRQLAEVRRLADHVVPIIEPVTVKTDDLRKTVNAWCGRGRDLVLIVNPRVGVATRESSKLVQPDDELRLSTSTARPGLLIGRRTSTARIESFLSEYAKNRPVLLHVDTHVEPAKLKSLFKGRQHQAHYFLDSKTAPPYRDLFEGTRVLLRDGFRRQLRNRDYPSESPFESALATFAQDGYSGFGDFSIVGDFFRDQGGRAHDVAIHLSYPGPRKSLRVRHLVNRGNPNWAIPRKFLDALEQLPAFLDSVPSAVNTSAVARFQELLYAKKFTSLGIVKGLSISHHIEVVVSLLKR